MSLVALSELLGATVRDATGTVRGRVREIAVAPQDHPTRIAYPDRQDGRTASASCRPERRRSARPCASGHRSSAWERHHAVRRRAAAQARPARSANHRRPRPQGRARQRRRARIDAGQQPSRAERRRGRRRRARRHPAARRRGRAVVHAARAARKDPAAGHPLAVRRSPRDRPGPARQAEDRLRRPRQAAPGRHRRHRRGPAAGRARSGVRDDRRGSRRRGARRARPGRPGVDRRVARQRIAPPTSSRRWIRTPPPTCSAT